jgi:MFS family permease
VLNQPKLKAKQPIAMPRTPGGTLVVLLLGQVMANADITIVNVAAPSIHTGLRASGGETEFVVSGYILAFAALLITGARLGASYGIRRIFLLGLVGFTAASLACGLAAEPTSLIVARMIQGAMAALMVPQVLSGIQRHFAGTARKRALGYYTLALSGGAVLGQVLGGVLISADLFGMGWRTVFLVNVPFGIVLGMVAARVLLDDPDRTVQRLDLRGVAMLSVAMVAIVAPLVLGHEAGWPLWAWISLAASVPLFAWFIAIERGVQARGGQPLVRLDILRRRTVRWGLMSYGSAVSTYFALLFSLALYLQQGLGKSPAYSGFAMVSWVAAFGLAGLVSTRLPTGYRKPAWVLGCLLMTIVYTGLFVELTINGPGDAIFFVLLGFGGFGLGLAAVSQVTTMTGAIPPDRTADLSGLINTTSQLSAVLGVATLGTLYLALAESEAATYAFATVLLGFATVTLFATVAAYRATGTATQG